MTTRSRSRSSSSVKESAPPIPPPAQIDIGASAGGSILENEELMEPDAEQQDILIPPVPIVTRFLTFVRRFVTYAKGSPSIKLSLFVVLMISVVLLVPFFFEDKSPNGTERINSFRRDFHILKTRFPAQSQDTMDKLWSDLSAALEESEPREPVSMILLVPSILISSDFPDCFAEVFGKAVNNAFRTKTPTSVLKLSAKRIMTHSVTDIHEELKSHFQNNKAVIISDIQNIKSPDHLTIFHAFCDNTHAPEKRAVYFFFVPLPDNRWEVHSPRNLAGVAKEILEELWLDVLSLDRIHPLLARVGSGSVILLNDGDTCATDYVPSR